MRLVGLGRSVTSCIAIPVLLLFFFIFCCLDDPLFSNTVASVSRAGLSVSPGSCTGGWTNSTRGRYLGLWGGIPLQQGVTAGIFSPFSFLYLAIAGTASP